MADVGLPGNDQVSLLATKQNTGLMVYTSSKQGVSIIPQNTGVLRMVTSYNYLYKCPAADNGIKNTQILWF